MRALNTSCGIAVLFTSLAYAHLVHHHLINAPHEAHHDPIFLVSLVAAAIAGVLSFVGAFLLLKRNPDSRWNLRKN
jgi:hypothetical protein